MAADEVFASLAGARSLRALADARVRLAFLVDALAGAPTLVTGPRAGALALLLAEHGVDVTVLEGSAEVRAEVTLQRALQPPTVAARVRVIAALAAPERFGAATVALGEDEPLTPDAPLALLASALAPGGRLVLLAPFAPAAPPSALVARVRALPLLPHALHGCGGFVALSAVAAPSPSAAAWDELASPAALLPVAEGAASAALERAAEGVAQLAADRRTLLARSSAEVRASVAALEAAHAQNLRLRGTVERTRRSARYRLGALVLGAARPSLDTLRLPGRILEIYRDKTGGEGEAQRPAPEAPLRRALDDRLDDFVRRLRRERPARLVVMFTGTTITGIRGNRPWLLTRVLRARGVPVIFGYAGTASSGELPPSDDPGLLELPVDLLAERLPDLAAADLGGARASFILSYPIAAAAPLLGRLGACGWATVYDSLDDWEEFARANVASWYSAGVERYVLAASDVVTAVSGPLAAKLEQLGGRSVALSPNAFDPAFLAPGYAPRRTAAVKIGYFGHLTPAWFDWGTLRSVARQRPSWTFEIIGHGAPAGLEVPANVHLLGPKPPHEICTFAAEWRAAIIPFRVGPLADAVDPIKVYEYLALGLPTVSLRMPQIAAYPYVTTVVGAEAFVAALDRALEVQVDRRVTAEFLDANTWARRVDQLLAATDRVHAAPTFEKRLHGGAP